MRRFSIASLAIVALFLASSVSSAQISAGTRPIEPIEFRPGTNTTVIKGTIARPMTPERQSDGSQTFTLRAQAGKFLKMEISSDNHLALFTLVKPSPAASRSEFVKDAAGVRRWSGTLEISGDYLVTVFAPDPDAFSRFKLRVTLR
ncbi:MAG TPA: hypothetical protein VGN86_06900 [Pyrinomonadaceae bacterium]|nr:hypothetical protein [Pyrinomonadaceae bacterium]